MQTSSAITRPAYADRLPNAERFEAWKFSTSNENGQPKVADPIDVAEARSFDDALSIAAPRCWHKDTLAILYTHEGRKTKLLRLYAIKQESKPTWVRSLSTGLPEAIKRRYPALLIEMEVAAFNPAERWAWSPDADPVGADRELVEQK